MATEKRSIEISYKADLKDLLSKLKQLPNVTAKEAKQMVGELNKQLKKAESEAKKTGQAMKKAGKEGAAGYKAAGNALRDLKESGDKAEESLEDVADQSGEVDRGFAAVGLALGQVNPALGEAAMKGADVAAVLEGLVLTVKNLNPALLATAAVIGVATLGYASYADGVKKATAQTLALRHAEKELRDSQRGIIENLQGALDILNSLRDEQDIYTGAITKEELARKKATKSAADSFESRISYQKDIIDGLKEDSRLVGILQKGSKALSDEEKARVATLYNQITGSKKALNLELATEKLMVKMKPIQAAISASINDQERALEQIVIWQEEGKEIAGDLFDIEQDLKQIEEDKAKKAKEEAEAKARAARLAAEKLEKMLAMKALAEMLLDLEAKTPYERSLRAIEKKHAAEKARAEDLYKTTGDQETYEAVLHELDIKRIKELEELEQKAHDKKMANLREGTRSALNDINTLSQLGIDKLEENVEKNEEAINKKFDAEQKHLKALFKNEEDKDRLNMHLTNSELNRKKELANADDMYFRERKLSAEEMAVALFRLQQAASLANIAMTTAENVNKYMGAGPLAPFLVGTAVASGITQAAVVLAQKPPSFHMGGLAFDAESGSPFLTAGTHAHLNPDEIPATLLSGESVLDRTTTRSLGGPEGIRRLQNNSNGTGEVIILQPFKHFDRYNRSARKRAGKAIGSSGY